MNYKSFNLGDWIGHISGVIEDETTLDGNEMRDLVVFLTTLNQQPCEDCISRQALKQKLQEHHNFFINAYGGFSNMSQNDKSRVDEIINCIAMVVNEPPVTPKEKTGWIPVSEYGYPKPEDEYKNFLTVDNKGEIDISEFYLSLEEEPRPYFSGMRNIVAWMPLPEPYKAGDTDESSN